MNDTHDNYERIELGLKAALLVGAIGFIVIAADRSHVTPAATYPSTAAASVAARSAYGGDNAGEREERDAYEPGDIAGRDTSYPDPSPDAVSDEGGHPSSF